MISSRHLATSFSNENSLLSRWTRNSERGYQNFEFILNISLQQCHGSSYKGIRNSNRTNSLLLSHSLVACARASNIVLHFASFGAQYLKIKSIQFCEHWPRFSGVHDSLPDVTYLSSWLSDICQLIVVNVNKILVNFIVMCAMCINTFAYLTCVVFRNRT